MLSQVVPSEELFNVVTSSNTSSEEKLQLIMNLKSHVKRDFVDITQVPKYLESLSVAIDIADPTILSNSFSVLSHLVKRVSIQDRSGDVLRNLSYLVLPIIINRLGDLKSNIKAAAKKALEAYWLTASKEVERAIMDIGLTHNSPKVVIESINWLTYIIVDVNRHFKLDPFVASLVNVLNLFPVENNVYLAVKELFKSYYDMKHNRLYKFDLQREFDLQHIPANIKQSILSEIDLTAAELHVQKRKLSLSMGISASKTTSPPALSSVPAFSPPEIHTADPQMSNVKPRLSSGSLRQTSRPTSLTNLNGLNRSNTISHTNSHNGVSRPSRLTQSVSSSNMQAETSSVSDVDAELTKLVQKIPNYALDTSIKGVDCFDGEDLYARITEIMHHFENRETEFNWAARERSIIFLRSLLRGNSADNFPEDLITGFRDVSDAICKAITSLRTTLSSHGCQLAKELALFLKSSADSVLDLLMPTLIKLCSATKNIASTNANMALCIIFLNSSFSYNRMNKILVASNEKNISPRSFSGLWLQIYVTRYHNSHAFLTPNLSTGNNGIDISKKILGKLLNDHNPTVRQSAKDTYWCFWTKFKTEAESFLSGFDLNIIKGVERSKPKGLSSNTAAAHGIPPKKTRPSIKDSIIAKNREMKSKQREAESGPPSRPSSRPTTRPASRITSRLSVENLDKDLNHRSSRIFSDSSKKAPNKIIGAPKRTSSVSSLNSPVDSIRFETRKRSDSATSLRSMQGQDGHTRVDLNQDLSLEVQPFDKKNDFILKLLSSNKAGNNHEGVNMLKYAIMCNEELSDETSTLLRKVSIEHPETLKDLLLGESLFKKSCKYFEPEDLIRLCSLLLDASDDTVQLLISVLEVDDIYKSSATILSYIANISNIIDDGQLTMQIIKHKAAMTNMLLELLHKCLDRIPINDGQFIKLVTVLFELINLLQLDDSFTSLSVLFKQLFSINSTLFSTELQMVNDITKDEVERIIGVSRSYEQSEHTNYGGLLDLTKVNFNKISDTSPLKHNSDFTMLVPSRRAGPDSTIVFNNGLAQKQSSKTLNAMDIDEVKSINLDAEPHFDKEVEDNIDFDDDDDDNEIPVNHTIQSDNEDDNSAENKSVDKNDEFFFNKDQAPGKDATPIKNSASSEPQNSTNELTGTPRLIPNNIFNNSDGKNRGELFSKFNQNESNELVEDFAQVKITELKKNQINSKDSAQSLIDKVDSQRSELNSKDSIQTFIDKVDPFSKMSNKNKPITIFHDDTVSGSPQKVKDYNYSELNWFNFQMAKLNAEKSESKPSSESDKSITHFQHLCESLRRPETSREDLIELLAYLQEHQSSEYAHYFESDGQRLLEDSLWRFFDSRMHDVHKSMILGGLMILKQLLINRSSMNLDSIWQVLTKLSHQLEDNLNELALAISETFDEILCGMYSTSSLLTCTINTLRGYQDENLKYSLLFVVDCLAKLLAMNSFNLLVDNTIIVQINDVLRPFVEHKDVDVRRLVILSYGRLLKASRVSQISHGNRLENSEEKNPMDAILQKFSVPQQKLVEYYSQE